MSIEDDIRRFAEQVDMQVKDVVHDTAEKIFREIVQKTAVGNPSIWENPESAPAGYTGGTLKASTKSQSETPDLNFLAREGSTNTPAFQVGALSENPTIFITNNQPYAQRVLVEGWSDQTPANMVQNAVQRAYNDIRNGIT